MLQQRLYTHPIVPRRRKPFANREKPRRRHGLSPRPSLPAVAGVSASEFTCRGGRLGLTVTARALLLAVAILVTAGSARAQDAGPLRAGAAAVDISPREFPVRIVGGFLERKATRVVEPLFARSLVLDNGQTSVAIVVVDNCLIPRDIFDRAKEQASRSTGIPVEHMLMSATHTHSAPAVVGALGTDVDENYPRHLPGWIAEAVERAAANLAPARIGWAAVEVPEHAQCRRWIRRPDRLDLDPFGHRTVRAMMHPGYQNPDYLGPSGPSDPDLSIVSVQSATGRPIAMLANYSMHYVGAEPVSADYFGVFGRKVAELLDVEGQTPAFVGMMSNGTSGDQWYMDYSKPRKVHTVDSMADALARVAVQATKRMTYHDRLPIAVHESTLSLGIRPITDEDRVRAEEACAKVGQRQPQKFEEVYPREQFLLGRLPQTHELKLQAMRIGDLGIAAIPCEVYAITGLNIKAHSPLDPTFTIELANGYDGYIPPPEQHALGGYTTWRARSACLEVQAEPKILAEVLALLERAAGRPRRTVTGDDYPFGLYPQAVLDSRPVAYWRLHEFGGERAADASGNGRDAKYEGGVAFYLDGPSARQATGARRANRAPQLAGGHIAAGLAELGERYTVEMWFYNCMPADARPITGYLFSRSAGSSGPGDVLAIGGTRTAPGRLFFTAGSAAGSAITGNTKIPPHDWHHVALVRDGKRFAVYLDGAAEPEIAGETDSPPARGELFLGTGPEITSSLEGRIDEVAVYDRPLAPDEIALHASAAKGD